MKVAASVIFGMPLLALLGVAFPLGHSAPTTTNSSNNHRVQQRLAFSGPAASSMSTSQQHTSPEIHDINPPFPIQRHSVEIHDINPPFPTQHQSRNWDDYDGDGSQEEDEAYRRHRDEQRANQGQTPPMPPSSHRHRRSPA